jgi:hypothetical protein
MEFSEEVWFLMKNKEKKEFKIDLKKRIREEQINSFKAQKKLEALMDIKKRIDILEKNLKTNKKQEV